MSRPAMRIAIVTDAWRPQVNGVVRTLERLAAELPALGAEACFVEPGQFPTVPVPSYPEIRLAMTSPRVVAARLGALGADHIHIATEGPLGLAAHRVCTAERVRFTTSYHTRFPEYLRARMPVPPAWTYAWLRRFHNAGTATLVATPSLVQELGARGFERLRLWSRGVDADLFNPERAGALDLPRPIFLYVGRVAVEKNLEAFLALDLPGTKLVVGDGPARAKLAARFSNAVFLGARIGEALATIYASADVFVFPSLTDTFGVVLLEALASGLPVAAFPVTGPLDVLGGTAVGVLGHDLRAAALAALDLDRGAARAHALNFGWRACAAGFLECIVPAGRTGAYPHSAADGTPTVAPS
jgi:glycosyltransferase involved in cell wall biosynthesis